MGNRPQRFLGKDAPSIEGGFYRKVGRPDIDAFEVVLEREGRQRGFFVASGYSRDAEDECRAFFKRTGRIIKLLTVQEILDEVGSKVTWDQR